MATDVVLPQSGLEVSEGTVVALDVAVGDRVAEGERLLEVETDKALSEGRPLCRRSSASRSRWGTRCPSALRLFGLGEPDDAEAAAGRPGSAAAGRAPGPGVAAGPPLTVAAPATASERRGAHRIRAAPIARRAALHLGVAPED